MVSFACSRVNKATGFSLAMEPTWRKTRFSVLIKSVLSGVPFAKNEGTFDGANPVQGALLPTRRVKRKKLSLTT
jgi:hypothetical protein